MKRFAIPALVTLALACSAAPSGDTTSARSSSNPSSNPRTQALAPSGSLVLGVAAYPTPSDGAMHAVAATTETLEEVDFDGTIVNWRRRLGYFAGVVATGAFYAPQDGNQHVIVATDQGDVHEVWFNPATDTYSDAPLAHFTSSVRAVDGFTSDDDGREHAIVATANGTITDVSWIPAQGITQDVIGHITGAVAVDGFYAPDDTNRIVHVATSGGALVEIFYHPGRGRGQSTIATFNGIVDIAGFYTPDDQDRHCIVATTDGVITEVYYNPSWGLGRAPIGNYAGVASVAGFYSPDGYRRVVIGTTGGSVSELHYSPTMPWGTLPLGTYYRPQPAFDDAGPTSVNGTVEPYNNSASGRVTQLAVASAYALAVSPNAGIWKLPYAADAQMGWTQLRVAHRGRAAQRRGRPVPELDGPLGEHRSGGELGARVRPDLRPRLRGRDRPEHGLPGRARDRQRRRRPGRERRHELDVRGDGVRHRAIGGRRGLPDPRADARTRDYHRDREQHARRR
jgi:hypothetical protein